MKLYVERFRNKYSTRDADTDDEWDNGDTRTEWSFGKIYATKTAYDYDSIEVGDNLKVGDRAFAVVVVHGDGCTFGHDEDCSADVFAIYDNVIDATEAKRIIESTVDKDFSDKVELPGGYRLDYLPWNGYFSSFGRCEIVESTIYP